MKENTKPYLLDVRLNLFDATTPAAPDPKTNTTGSTDLSVEMKTYYSDYLIDLAEPELIHDQFGQKHPIPKVGGKIIEFRQFDPLPELTTPITEGVTPDGQSLSAKGLTAAVAQYGGYVTLSDMIQLTAIDNHVVQATKLCASQAGRTLDTITREVLAAGTNVQYAGGVTSRSDITAAKVLTVDDIKKAVRFVHSSRAKVFAKAGATPSGTGAVAVDVYATLILGDDAYGVTEIEGGGLQHIVKPLGSAGTADPLNQRSTVGWKATKVAKILVPQYMVRIESGATA